MLMALSRPGIPFYLVVNRAPAGVGVDDRRVKEIQRNVAALLTASDLPLFIISSMSVQDGVISSPEVERLRKHIIDGLRSKSRQEELHMAFLTHLQDLATLLRAELERRLRNAQMDEESVRFMQREVEELNQKFQYAISGIVTPGFRKIKEYLPSLIQSCRKEMEDTICSTVEEQHIAGKDETIAYTNSHLLPFYSRKESENIQHYLRAYP